MSYTILLIPFFPLLGSLFLLFLGQKLKRIHTSIIGTGSVCCSFVLCLFLFSSFLAGGNNLADKNFEYYFYPWLELDGLQVSVSFLLDSLSFVMVLIITGVGFLIHLYSVGYMKEENPKENLPIPATHLTPAKDKNNTQNFYPPNYFRPLKKKKKERDKAQRSNKHCPCR